MASIRKTPSGKWKAQVLVGPGKFRTKTFPSRAQAQVWAREIESQKDKGTLLDNQPVTVAGLWEPILVNRKAALAPATVARNVTHWEKYVKPRWGETKVATIRRSQVQAWVAELVEAGHGVPTIEAAVRLLSAILAVAVDDRLLADNPARSVQLPKHQPGRRRFITRDELDKVLAKVDSDHDRLLLSLMATTGLGIGEALGLTRADLARDCSTVSVHRVWTRHGYKDFPKAASRVRTIPVPVSLREPLKAHTATMLPAASVFTGDDRNLARRVLEPACEAAGVEAIGLHGLRHHAASTWIAAGLPLFEVARALGHSSTRMVEVCYGHLVPGHHDRLLAAMQG